MKEKKTNLKLTGNIDDEFLAATRVVCKCGHTVNFISRVPYIECNHCHDIIFRDKKAEYNYRVKRRLGVFK